MFFNKKEKPFIIPPSYFKDRDKNKDKQKPKQNKDGESSI